jgi:hypothetical protein
MVTEDFIDMTDGSGSTWRRGWRCVNYGNLVDRVIAQYRAIQASCRRPFVWPSPGDGLLLHHLSFAMPPVAFQRVDGSGELLGFHLA